MSCELIEKPESKNIFKGKSNLQVLENIRFFKGEKDNCHDLGSKLANLGDLYVFDAFGTSHRKQASTYAAIEKASNACAGLLLEKENKYLTQALNNFDKPFIAVVGGAKVSSKLKLLKHINSVADHIIVGGGIANTFLKAAGFNIGKSLVEDSMISIAKEILESEKIVLPKNVVTSSSFEGENISGKSILEITEDEMILDLGIDQDTFSLINKSKTILWNGPAGYFENINFRKGSFEIAKKIVEKNKKNEIYSVAGGGDTVAALNNFGLTKYFNFVSTAGGAFLEFLEGNEWPGIKALE